MYLSELLGNILNNPDLEAKLQYIPSDLVYDDFSSRTTEQPVRAKRVEFSDKQFKFPRGNFHEKEKVAVALHSFANHELLAIEIMAAALQKFPATNDQERRLRKGIVQAMREEQKHFKLYHERLNELGYEFGDFPLNDFFWRYFQRIESMPQYLSVMALTFEAANLDFATYFAQVFRENGDEKTASILDIVLEDEIGHVALGARYLNLWKEDKSLWEYYQACLPWPLTPARSKGKKFFKDPRKLAKLGEDFIDSVEGYQDKFTVTNRREWKA